VIIFTRLEIAPIPLENASVAKNLHRRIAILAIMDTLVILIVYPVNVICEALTVIIVKQLMVIVPAS